MPRVEDPSRVRQAEMKRGKAITVAPLDQRPATQQAADLLGIGRPTLIKPLEHHETPTNGLPTVGTTAVDCATSWTTVSGAVGRPVRS